MIRVRLQGRLGNQLFQYAFAVYAASRLKTKFVFDVRKEDGFQLRWFHLRFPFNLISSNNLFFRIYNWLQRFVKTEKSFVALNGKEDWSKTVITDNTSYKGYFQDSRFSTALKQVLNNEFSIKKKYALKFQTEHAFFMSTPYAVLHIRFGDYENLKITINNTEANWSLPVQWYQNALKNVNRSFFKLVVVSDDLEAAKKVFNDGSDTIFFPQGDVITHFQFLLHADVCIISNSTFAWWGAFLNKKPNKKVYAPENFVGYNAGSEFPKGIMNKEFIWI